MVSAYNIIERKKITMGWVGVCPTLLTAVTSIQTMLSAELRLAEYSTQMHSSYVETKLE